MTLVVMSTYPSAIGAPNCPANENQVTGCTFPEAYNSELAENSDRKDFLPSEIEAIRRAMAPKEREAAKDRTSANLPNAKLSHLESTGRSIDKIGSFAGVSGRTVEKIAAKERQVAGKEVPETFGKARHERETSRSCRESYRHPNGGKFPPFPQGDGAEGTRSGEGTAGSRRWGSSGKVARSDRRRTSPRQDRLVCRCGRQRGSRNFREGSARTSARARRNSARKTLCETFAY